jgi:hypothetical protein
VTDQQVVAHPDAAVSAEFTELASDERIAKATAALERNGIRPLLAATGADARGLVGSLLVDGAEVYNNTSQTLEAIGVADDIDPAATSRSGCGCTGWTGKCSAARCAPWPRRPTTSSAACTR